MKRPNRVTVVHASFVLFAVAVVGRAAYVQLWQAQTWRTQANRQHNTSQALPAPRGAILDATGTVLVESRPLVELAVAPKETRSADRTRLATLLRAADVPDEVVARVADTSRAWVPVPGRYLSADVSTLVAMRGVHTEPAIDRVPTELTGLQGIVGHAAPDGGGGVDGLELSLDSLLRGTAGIAAEVRDARGSRLLSPNRPSKPATPGHQVTLTIRFDLQDIAERALADAVQKTGARGGDVVVLDPRNGELLALASRRAEARATTATALTEPVEPGSTLKPFVAAALLERGRVSLDDKFDTHNGEWTMYGFKLTDVHKAAHMTFSEIIEYSSNIGMAQAALRLTPREEYEALRDFGFGTPTGLPFPSEASGVLREPKYWTAPTQSALGRGYEMMATPVQLAAAYGAIANGGELLQPSLVKEVRDNRGTVVYHHEREVVRRVISKPVAAQMRRLLRAVVDSGTATRADLATFEVGGKSGTAKRTERGKYVDGDYTATFVGLFPADDPQLVVLVKLDSPNAAAYYGGQIAAPVTKVVLEAALASRDAVLDRSRLHPRARGNARATQLAAAAPIADTSAGDIGDDGSSRFVLKLPPAKDGDADVVLAPRAVPDVRGLSIREATRALHAAGFRVHLTPGGVRGATAPSAGATVAAGTLVRLQYGT